MIVMKNRRSKLTTIVLLALAACSDHPKTCPTACTGNDVCIAGECVDAYSRDWVFTAATITVAPTEPDGTGWDTFGDPAPDPYANISVDGIVVLTTDVSSDTYDADWNQASKPIAIMESSQIQVEAIDSDTLGDGDLIESCPDTGTMPLTIDMLRAGRMQCIQTGSTMTIQLTPGPSADL